MKTTLRCHRRKVLAWPVLVLTSFAAMLSCAAVGVAQDKAATPTAEPPAVPLSRDILRRVVKKDGRVDREFADKNKLARVTSLHVTVLLYDSVADTKTPVSDPAKTIFDVGQQFYVQLEADSDLYVYIFYQAPSGELDILLPDPKLDKNGAPLIRKGERRILPDDSADTAFVFSPPGGAERLLMFASPERRPDLEKGGRVAADAIGKGKALADTVKAAQVEFKTRSIDEWLSAEVRDPAGGTTVVVGSQSDAVKPKLFHELVLTSRENVRN